MKAAPTLDGRIRIDLEDAIDLAVLRAIVGDARGRDDDLASQVSAGTEPELAEDWEDFVLPDLRATFDAQLETVVRALREVAPGDTVFIGGDEAEAWFGALNQARLALEERFGLSRQKEEELLGTLRPVAIRAHFYQMLQGMLLHFLMTS